MIQYTRNSNGSWNKVIGHIDDVMVGVNNTKLIELNKYMKVLNVNAEIELEEDRLKVKRFVVFPSGEDIYYLERLLKEHWKMIYDTYQDPIGYDWLEKDC